MNFNDLFKLNRHFINLGGYVKYFKYALLERQVINSVSSADSIKSNKSNDRCYICALGPSLKEVDFNKLDGDTIVVNRFYKFGHNYPAFKPTYYLMIDALFAEDNNRQDFFDALEYYKNDRTLFLLNSKLSNFSEIEKYRNHIAFLSCCKGLFNAKKKYELGKVMPAFGNVACTAIAIAMALNYKEIVLLGCDFNSFASRKKIHCYNETNDTRTLSLAYELYCYSLVAEMHNELNNYARSKGIKIINSTKGSLIDAYPYQIDDNLYK